MSGAIRKGKLDWKNIKVGKKQEHGNEGDGFSLHLEATTWSGRETGAHRPAQGAPVPPKQAPLLRAHKPVWDPWGHARRSRRLRVMCLTSDPSCAHRQHRRRDQGPDR